MPSLHFPDNIGAIQIQNLNAPRDCGNVAVTWPGAGGMGAVAMSNRLIKAWLLCGSLDIAFAIVGTLVAGGSVPAMLRGVAAGPFGDAVQNWGMAGALAGLAVHFTLMLIMVSVFALLLQRTPLGRLPWLVSGAIYGVGLWLVMYGVVLPARFGTPFPMPDLLKAFLWFSPHVLCVGWPAAWILQSSTRPQVER